jgi:VanZ family protein
VPEVRRTPDPADALPAEPLEERRSSGSTRGPLGGVLLLLLVGWTILAGYLFLTPDPEEYIETVQPTLGHALIFTALGATAVAWRPARRWRYLGLVFGLGVLAGIAVEALQNLMSVGRSSQLGDVIADGAGLAFGMAAVTAAQRAVRRSQLVNLGTAVLSGIVLLGITGVALIGPRDARAWWDCRGHGAAQGTELLRVDATGVAVRGDSELAAQLEQELQPLFTGNGYRFEGSQGVGVDRARAVACGLRSAGSFTIVARLDDLPPSQEGPARIVTLSEGVEADQIDLHLAMGEVGASVRLRLDQYTLLDEKVPAIVGQGPLELVLTYDGELLELSANQRVVWQRRVDADPSSWRYDLPLTIGNEHGGDRGLTGTLTELQIYAGAVHFDRSSTDPDGSGDEGSASTLYVRPDGNDGADGQTLATAWRTLGHALARATPGTTTYVLDGTYTQPPCATCGAHFRLAANGRPDGWIRLRNYPGNAPHILATAGTGIELVGSYLELTGFTITGEGFGPDNDWGYGIMYEGGHHITIRDNIVSGFPLSGIGGTEVSGLTIEGNIVHDNARWNSRAGSGISFWKPVDHGLDPGPDGYHDRIVGNLVFGNENLTPTPEHAPPGLVSDGNGIIVDETLTTHYPGRILVADNVAIANGGKGINVFKSANVDVVGNTLSANGSTMNMYGPNGDLSVSYSRNVVIRGNRVRTEPERVPLRVVDSRDVTTQDNTISSTR